MNSPEKKELAYATHDGVELKGDLYLPDGEGPFPAMVLVHGGGWTKGSKEKWKNWGPYLVGRGIASFAVSYRLARPGRPAHPHSVWDVRSAIQYVRGRASEFGIDTSRLGGMGTSAGAHLVSLVALAGDNPAFSSPYPDDPFQDLSAKLKLAVVICGVYDMLAQWEHDQLLRPGDHITEMYLGGNPMNLREKFYEASPLYHASAQNAAGTKWLVAWGTADDVVDYKTQALPFLTNLTRAGALVRGVELVGADHFWTTEAVDSNIHSRNFVERLHAFLSTWAGW